MELVLGVALIATLGWLAVASERSQNRRTAVRVWSDEYERRLANGRSGWPLE
jgi:hypothetical protein